ncbi:uclacyanin-2-like [Tripterygium wilfordii]|uniref:Uclacyanin-2-like n=1 Tax=Tripterygium wilfordii TaxID=458696 RepID=A0A7J7CFA1_TRIWF|nr:uclacyanin-3-like [Tripterygium wilfordii]KAF5732864.1 uclacyanin-2-like [Tripterygium wilfordii]
MAMAITALLVLLVAAPAVQAVDHIVGDSLGWTQGFDYSTWAAAQTFTVGDNLVFNYDSSHQVSEVSSTDYTSCSSSNSIKTYNDGNTKIALNKAGSLYFICPALGHCGGGMKVSVNVVAAASSDTPSPGSSTPTTPGTTTPSTTPGTTTSSPSTPSTVPAHSGAIGVFGHMNVWLMGVLGTIVVAFMV